MWGGRAAPPPPVKPEGIPGCLKVAIILGVILIVATIVLVVVLGQFADGLLRSAGINPDEVGNGGANRIGADCPFLSDEAARDVVGGNADAAELSGILDASLGLVIDKRTLPNAPDCVITDGQKTYLVRLAKSDGNGAAAYAREKANAQPISQDQGGGVTLENPGYFGGDVSGIGDEAFCTGLSNAIMAGVVVRKGDTVVAVSVGPPSEGDQSVPDMQDVGGVTTAPGLCQLAQDIARKVLP